MARKTFFSFHYADVWRAMNVRNSWVLADSAGFVDKADFEEVERKGEAAIKAWIDEQLKGTSVTVVLIGTETSERKYVKYELEKSFARGNGMLGIWIDGIKDSNQRTAVRGSNQFGEIGKDENGKAVYFSSHYTTYDWIANNGRDNLGKWIEAAAKAAGR
jgi:hypothetical protein